MFAFIFTQRKKMRILQRSSYIQEIETNISLTYNLERILTSYIQN